MQEQLAEAMKGAMGTVAPGLAVMNAASDPGLGKKILGAMAAARTNGCECAPCVTLRGALDATIAGFLESALEETSPAAAAPAAVEFEAVVEDAGDGPGHDSPA